jgi:hypothetical protein
VLRAEGDSQCAPADRVADCRSNCLLRRRPGARLSLARRRRWPESVRGGDKIPAGNEKEIPAGDGDPFSLEGEKIPGSNSAGRKRCALSQQTGRGWDRTLSQTDGTSSRDHNLSHLNARSKNDLGRATGGTGHFPGMRDQNGPRIASAIYMVLCPGGYHPAPPNGGTATRDGTLSQTDGTSSRDDNLSHLNASSRNNLGRATGGTGHFRGMRDQSGPRTLNRLADAGLSAD